MCHGVRAVSLFPTHSSIFNSGLYIPEQPPKCQGKWPWQALTDFSLKTSKKKKRKENPLSLQSLPGKALWQFCLSQNGHISTLSQNVGQRGWVTLLDQPGTGGANDVQAYSHYKECRRCPSTKGPDQEDWETIRKEWAASVEMTGATGHNWQTREAQGQIDANHRRWGGRLEGERWEGKENYRGGRRRRERRKTTEAQISFSTHLSAFSFFLHPSSPHSVCPYGTSGTEVPRPSQQL